MLRGIDLFAGIGGFHYAMKANGIRCVFASEIDPHARQSYEANHGLRPAGDIRRIASDAIPDFDILFAGFPCQTFSIAGVSKLKSLGRAHGLADQTRGTLFFEIARILRDRQPKAFLLENVKNLIHHDDGKTFAIILDTLYQLDYAVVTMVIDARSWVPQRRERIYLFGFKDLSNACRLKVRLNGLINGPTSIMRPVPRLSQILSPNPHPCYTLSNDLWNYLQGRAQRHREKGNGFGFKAYANTSGAVNTLSARYGKDGSEILIAQPATPDNPHGNPRRLTPRECARLMGYPESHRIVVSDAQAYKQFGNSVVVPVVTDLTKLLVDVIAGGLYL